ncbi:MAG: transglycosylase domain-containing protein, partial [Acidimicrobiia bacterium]|nr:transglycosylase domain-containing protein [Acidimicrobiia bacterium]
DKRFWEHDGIDYEGIARAARINLEVGGIAQGGSTLTQQYVKNVYLTTEQTFERKVSEALLATELEKVMTKEEILFGYLTTSYYGSGAYGIGAAAKIYFDKDVADLDISEAATLAGVVKAPTSLSPFVDREAADERRRLVLQAMLDQGYLDEEDYEREAARRLWSINDEDLPNGPVTALIPRDSKGALDHHFFVDYVEAELIELFGPDLVYNGGLRVETTIDTRLQEVAEEAVARRLGNTEYPIEMALATVDPETGHILAMVGGRDYEFSQVNLATGGSTGFQPGSSFKPLVLAAAFRLGLNPDTRYPAPARWQVPGCTGGSCTISNYSPRGYGNITLRQATAASVNTVYAQLVIDVTIDDTVELARKLGLSRIDPDQNYGASLALGAAESSPLEMASAYGTFANRGVRVVPTSILRVIDADGNVLVDNRARAGERVLDEAVADNVTDVLTDVIESGTGKAAAIGRPAAGKTGTAQAYRAAWFVGYTPQLSTAVWMGHADRLASLRNVNGVGSVTGGSHPAVAWREFMGEAHDLLGLDPQDFPDPAPIVPIADSAREIITSYRTREETRVGNRQTPRVLEADCGTSCVATDTGPPAVARAEVPTTLPPPTTVPPDGSGDGGATATTGSKSGSTTPTTTATTGAPTTTAPQASGDQVAGEKNDG